MRGVAARRDSMMTLYGGGEARCCWSVRREGEGVDAYHGELRIEVHAVYHV